MDPNSSNYHVLELIGEGSYGKVYRGRRKYTGQVVALKFISKTKKAEKEVKNLRREIDIMRSLQHPNIVQMLDSFDTEHDVVVVTEFAHGELFQILQDDRTLPEDQVQSIAAQLISALYYLHARRILHRDMKPQNILLGKGGVVKLCDFGFARAMSYNTLVLTSIKGTPLYMSPELVLEQPYDHTADLWALACILYELFIGEPPFFADGLYRLIDMVVHNPVRWPGNFPPDLRDFLERLLIKDPRKRLSWPELLDHPYIKDLVQVAEEDKHLPSPFTQAPTASMIFEKERQARERALPPGCSKLGRYRERNDADKRKPKTEAWTQPPVPTAAAETTPAQPSQPTQPAVRVISPIEEVAELTPRQEPTPRPADHNRSNEPPKADVESSRVVSASGDHAHNRSSKKNFDNVKLNEEEADSDDEWQSLVDATDSEAQKLAAILSIMKDKTFISKLKNRLSSSSSQVLEAVLEGASRLRPVLHIINNLITLKCDAESLMQFATSVDIPAHLLSVTDQILQKPNVRQQAWCQQILIDLVRCLHAYLASSEMVLETNPSDVAKEPNVVRSRDVTLQSQNRLQLYVETVIRLLNLVPRLVSQKFDTDLRLREHTLLCLIYASELMEHQEVVKFFDTVADSNVLLETLLHCCVLDEQAVRGLEAHSSGNPDLVHQRMDDGIMLGIATIVSLVHLPLSAAEPRRDIKAKVALAFGDMLCLPSVAALASDYLLLLNHPETCATVLKAVYSAAQHSVALCKQIANSQRELHTLLDILHGKVEIVDIDVNIVLEVDCYLLAVLIIQLGSAPAELEAAAPLFMSIFVESQIASHAAAAALLLSQLSSLGIMPDVQPEELVNASFAVLTELSQIFVRCPMNHGILDGLVSLLSQTLAQGEMSITSMLVGSGIWTVFWQRLAQVIHVDMTQPDTVIHDMDSDSPTGAVLPVGTTDVTRPPDWSLLSFKGLSTALGIAIAVFIKESSQLLDVLSKSDDLVLPTLVHLVSPNFLRKLCECFDRSEVAGIVLQVTQICCLPFAVDASEELLQNIQCCYRDVGILDKLFSACMTCLRPEQLDLPIGLVCRLALSDAAFIDQFVSAVEAHKAFVFIASCMTCSNNANVSVAREVLSLCGHLARTSQKHLSLIIRIIEGPKHDYQLLSSVLMHDDACVRSRACSLLGNVLKHSAAFYNVLADSKQRLLAAIIDCLRDEDPEVRKSASYAIGNAAFHSDQLYSLLRPSIPLLLHLLQDQLAKIRANAAGALGNLAMNSGELCKDLIKEKALLSLLDVACHDPQVAVQETALMALRTMVAQPSLKQELQRLNAVDRLLSSPQSVASAGNDTMRTATPSPRSRSAMTNKSFLTSGRQSATGAAQQRANLIRILTG